MDLLSVILKSLGTSFGIMGAFLILFIIGAVFWVRRAVQDRVYCYFLSGSRQLKGKLHKPEADNTIVVGSGADAPKYMTHSSKQFWSFWPPGFPRFIQEPVPSLIFVQGSAEPLDPFDRTSLISPEALRKISDEAMLKQTWKDVRETLGIRPAIGGNMLLILCVLLAVLIGGIGLYFSMQNMNQLDAISKALGVS